ncbi:hypothetical protein ACW69C_22505 [Streptomyces sp. MN3]|uniref:hypothetical protein n=1 Tax=Streptomyces sp. yara TaxID=3458421 RepID=UPI00403FFA3A
METAPPVSEAAISQAGRPMTPKAIGAPTISTGKPAAIGTIAHLGSTFSSSATPVRSRQAARAATV